jgi:hypothetical protein
MEFKASMKELVGPASSHSDLTLPNGTIKGLVGDKISSTFQFLKVYGGILSAGAGYYAAVKDLVKAGGMSAKGEYGLVVIYIAKSGSQFVDSTFGMLSSLSYAPRPMKKSGLRILQFSGRQLIARRLFFMTWRVRLNMVGLALTAIVRYFSPDPLKEWCEMSPFGPLKKDGRKGRPVND